MSTTTAARPNDDQENILRSRTGKPANPAVARTLSEEGLLKDLGPLPKIQLDENGMPTNGTNR